MNSFQLNKTIDFFSNSAFILNEENRNRTIRMLADWHKNNSLFLYNNLQTPK